MLHRQFALDKIELQMSIPAVPSRRSRMSFSSVGQSIFWMRNTARAEVIELSGWLIDRMDIGSWQCMPYQASSMRFVAGSYLWRERRKVRVVIEMVFASSGSSTRDLCRSGHRFSFRPISHAVKSRQHQQCQQRGRNDSTDHNGCKRALDLCAGTNVKRHRQKAQRRDQGHHEDGRSRSIAP